ncbi:hypothetical protein AB2B41_18970 [Marimonas sp. MJW-29]|uniref:Uncharacterized protein n=1 Tax=Sulfitobacter sediminis TaxID=3234186 RepID=A0ABV3RRR3_9RHOB
MKKGATPELDSKWWSKNKAKTMKKSGLGAELKSFETLKAKAELSGQTDAEIAKAYADTLKQLKVVKTKIPVAIKACNDKLHKDTVEALKKYPKIIQAEETRLTQLAKDYAAKAKGGGKKDDATAPKQKKGKPGKIWGKNVWTELAKVYKTDWIKQAKGGDLELVLNSDIIDVLEDEGDYVTPQQMVDDCNALFKRLLKDVVDTARKIDAAVGKKTPQEVDKLRENFAPMVNRFVASYKADFEKIPKVRWAKFQARKTAYKNYQIETGLKITQSTLGVAGAAAGIVGTGGAGLVLGIVGLVRSVAALAKEIHKAAQEAETVGKALVKDLNTLQVRYRTAEGQAKKTQGAAEVGGSVLKGILGVDAPFIATLPKCDDNFTLWGNKVDGLSVKARKTSADVMKGIKACEALETKLKNASDKKAQKIYQNLRKARVGLSSALDGTSDLMGRVTKEDKARPVVKKVLEELKSTNPKYADVFDRAFPALVNLGLAGASAGVSYADATAKTLDHVKTSLGLFNDIASEGQSQLEATLG